MADLLELEKLYLFIIFFIPGFISLKIWSLIVPTENRKTSDYFFDIISYSAINFAALFWLIYIIIKNEYALCVNIILTIIVLLVAPVLWPIIISWILKSGKLKGKIVHPTPKAWDFFFSQGEPCFMLIHLKSGKYIGGLYSGKSFASSFPHPEDIYLEEVWKVDEQGKFKNKIESSKGILINREFINYIELFEVINEER